MTRMLAVATVTLSLLAAGCGGDADVDAPAASGATTTAAPASTPTTARGSTTTSARAGDDSGAADLELATTDLGAVLVDGSGMTLYLFTPDSQGASTCEAECAERWPAVPTVSSVGEGLDGGLLGTTTRADGDVQATYNGWPLYRFGGDQVPGDVNGQGIGDVWFVVDAAGKGISAAP